MQSPFRETWPAAGPRISGAPRGGGAWGPSLERPSVFPRVGGGRGLLGGVLPAEAWLSACVLRQRVCTCLPPPLLTLGMGAGFSR